MTGQKKAARRRVEKGTPLYEWRMGLGITQEDAAKEFGCGLTKYRKMENVQYLPTIWRLALDKVIGR